MIDNDIAQFSSAWASAQELAGKETSDGALALAFNLLKKYPLQDIKKALIDHLSDPQLGKFAPKPADVIFQIGRANHDGRLEADEAWSLAIKSFDEHQTVVLNDEIAGALGLSGDIYRDGDKLGARLAFRASYEKIVESNRNIGKPVRWWPSLGHSVNGRQHALEQAVVDGYLDHSQVKGLLPAPISSNVLALIQSKVPQLAMVGGDLKKAIAR